MRKPDVTNFRLLWSFVFNVEAVIGSPHFVYVSSASNVLEVHAASIFMVKVGRVVDCLHLYSVGFGPTDTWGKVGDSVWFGLVGTVKPSVGHFL